MLLYRFPPGGASAFCWMPLRPLGHQRPRAFAETPLRYSHRASFHRGLPRNTTLQGAWPGPSGSRLTWGQQNPETDGAVPVVRDAAVEAVR